MPLSMRTHNAVETLRWLGAAPIALAFIAIWLLDSAARAVVAPIRRPRSHRHRQSAR
jgi:hypothetical protein